ncbi:MAG TPA: hypothetical protein EYN73_08370 [Chromatiaceae bacterium]|jgi:hypothetical protein|nr:hypothetical protein [Chromatiaceae bacterium]HIB85240.1 hypothetical protein [Chromatiaceae bacterium]HIO02625.1 hypothetical protein [Alphaproteobacteria bacterium]HIO55005.1 hypothetical protein [Chromatiales bacterium]
MPNLLDEFRASHTLHKVIEAEDYNRVRLALSRLSNPLALDLPSINCLEILLTDKYWLCTDSCVGDRPILAWTAFESSGRSALDAPVPCELRLYHTHAGLVMGNVLEHLEKELQQRLDAL